MRKIKADEYFLRIDKYTYRVKSDTMSYRAGSPAVSLYSTCVRPCVLG